MPAPDHTHHFKALDGGCRRPHRLKASGGPDDSLECTMIRFDDVVHVFAGSMSCVGRQLALTLQPVDCFRVGAELVGGDRGRRPVAHRRQCFS